MTRLTAEDLEFLIHSKIALRIQHKSHHDAYERMGNIRGDAYSLSDPEYWLDDIETKPAIYERELGKLVDGFFGYVMAGRKETNFLLFQNVEGAGRPIEGRYPPPFRTVGSQTLFKQEQCIQLIRFTAEEIVQMIGAADAEPTKELLSGCDKLEGIIVDKIIDAIVQARTAAQGAGQAAAIKETIRNLRDPESEEGFLLSLRTERGERFR